MDQTGNNSEKIGQMAASMNEFAARLSRADECLERIAKKAEGCAARLSRIDECVERIATKSEPRDKMTENMVRLSDAILEDTVHQDAMLNALLGGMSERDADSDDE